MTLIKCKECGKQISDTANVCMGCGAPVGGGGSVGNVAFEKRIEEYKDNGYKLLKREGDTVTMLKSNFVKHFLYLMACVVISIAFGVFLLVISSYYFAMATVLIMTGVSIWSVGNTFKVKITINKIGKIEESGNMLKKK